MKRAFVIALTFLVIVLFACANRPVATFAQTQGLKPTTIPEAIKKLQQLNHMTPGLDWPEQKEIKAAFMSDKTPPGEEGHPTTMVVLETDKKVRHYFFAQSTNIPRKVGSPRMVAYMTSFQVNADGKISDIKTLQPPIGADVCEMDAEVMNKFQPYLTFIAEISALDKKLADRLTKLDWTDKTPKAWLIDCSKRNTPLPMVTKLAPPTEMTTIQVSEKFSGNMEVIFVGGNEVHIPNPLAKWRIVPAEKIKGLSSPTTNNELFQRLGNADIGICSVYVQADRQFTFTITKGFGSDKKQIIVIAGNELAVKTINPDGKDEPLVLPYLSAILKQWPDLRPLFQELLMPSSGQ